MFSQLFLNFHWLAKINKQVNPSHNDLHHLENTFTCNDKKERPVSNQYFHYEMFILACLCVSRCRGEKFYFCTPLRNKDWSTDGGTKGTDHRLDRGVRELRREKAIQIGGGVSLWTGSLFLLQVGLDLGCTRSGAETVAFCVLTLEFVYSSWFYS